MSVSINTWCRPEEEALWFSNAAWSLAAIVQWWETVHKTKHPKIWVPSWGTSLSFAHAHHPKLFHYTMKESFEPNMDYCYAQAKEHKPDIFILVHYFGYPAPSKAVANFCTQQGCLLVEDATHMLRPCDKAGSHGGMVVYQPSEFLSFSRCSLLMFRPKSPCLGHVSAEFGQQTWQTLKNGVFKGKSNTLRRTLKVKAGQLKRHLNPFERVLNRIAPFNIGELSWQALTRRRHALIWRHLIERGTKLKALYNENQIPDCPHWGLFRAEAPEDRKFAAHRLHGIKTLTRSWNDFHLHEGQTIPDLIRNTLFLPLRPRVPIGKISKAFHIQSTERIVSHQIKTDELGRHEWQQRLDRLGVVPMNQTWAFGQAKQQTDGWKIRNQLITVDGQETAVVQMREKRVLGLGRVIRISRGPLFLNYPTSHDLEVVYRYVSQMGNRWHAKMLIMSPELLQTGEHLVLLERLGFQSLLSNPYSSAWLDLRQDLKHLRSQFLHRWRNRLTKAENSELEIRSGHSRELFENFAANYQQFKRKKNFEGASDELLRAVHANLEQPSQGFMMQAYLHNEPVAGSYFLLHEKGVSHFIAWIDEKGRESSANYLIVWRALQELQKMGCEWFDLCGIDYENTPNVAFFKDGMNAHHYQLIGEYYKL